MSKINYVEGDLFKHEFDRNKTTFITHVCNDKGGYGSGFVVPLSKYFPKARTEYLRWHKDELWLFLANRKPFELGQTQFVENDNNVIVCNMVAQTLGGIRPLFYDKLVDCMRQVYVETCKYQNCEIVAPLFGTDLAGGSLEVTLPLIQDIWTKNNVPVTLYYLKDSSLTESLRMKFS